MNKKLCLGLCAALTILPVASSAQTIIFDFTGGLVVVNNSDQLLGDPAIPDRTIPITASLSYDTVSGIGGSDLSITANGATIIGFAPTFHDITMQRQGTSNLITGNVLVDWNTETDWNLHVEWDASGLYNAIAQGLAVGNVISGTRLYDDANGNKMEDPLEFIADVGSATPYSDSIVPLAYVLGPAPMATTSNSLGLLDGPYAGGIRGLFEIGTGNSMVVTEILPAGATVPVPASVWLFGSGLIGLAGVVRRKKS